MKAMVRHFLTGLTLAAVTAGIVRAETVRVPCTASAESVRVENGGSPKNYAPQGVSIHFGGWHPNHKLPGYGRRFGYLQFEIPESLAGLAIQRVTLHAHCLRHASKKYPANANFSYVSHDDWDTVGEDRPPPYAVEPKFAVYTFANPGDWWKADVTGYLLLSGEGAGKPLTVQVNQLEGGHRGMLMAGPNVSDPALAPYLEIEVVHPDDGPPILVAEEADAAVRNAAYVLQKMVSEVTGEVPAIRILTRGDPIPAPALVVDRGWLARKAGVDPGAGGAFGQRSQTPKTENRQPRPPAALKPDGFIVRTVEDRLVLTGADGRGVLYAVMDYLERDLGCRWLAPGRTILPTRNDYPIAVTERREEPTFVSREVTYAADPLWKAANRATNTSGLWGGNYSRVHFNPHRMHNLVPGSKYFTDHPGWFAEQNGIRFHEGGQHDYHNPELIDFVAEAAIDALKRNPDWPDYWIAQLDCLGWPQDPVARALDGREGSTTASFMHFINRIAGAVDAACPGQGIATLAYHFNLTPPRTMSYHPNVRLYLCTPWSFHNTANITDSGAVGQYYLDMVRDWKSKCDTRIAWMYHIEGPDELSWYLDTLQQDYRALYDAGIQGAFVEIRGQAPYDDLKVYLLHRLFWNIDADLDALVREFHHGYFGREAAPGMLEYYRTVCADPGSYGSRGQWLDDLEAILAETRARVPDEDTFASRKIDAFQRSVLANRIKDLWPTWAYHDGAAVADLRSEEIDSLLERVRVLGESLGMAYPTRDTMTLNKPAIRLANSDLEVICMPEGGTIAEIRDRVSGLGIGRGSGPAVRPVHVVHPPHGLGWGSYEFEAGEHRLAGKATHGDRAFTRTVALDPTGTSVRVTTTLTQDGPAPESDVFLTRFEFDLDGKDVERGYFAYRDGEGRMHIKPIRHPWECLSSGWGPTGLVAILDAGTNTGLLWELEGKTNGCRLRIGPRSTDTVDHLGTRRNIVLDLYGERIRVGAGDSARHEETITYVRDAGAWCRANGLQMR
jgi:hypothetical protein